MEGERKRYDIEFKKKIVAELREGGITIRAMSAREVIPQVCLRRWSRDIDLGGEPNAFTRASRYGRVKAARRNGSTDALPTLPDSQGYPRARTLVPTAYDCPHCGGRVRLPTDRS